LSLLLDPPTLTTERLRLTPLRPEDAEEMTAVLADERLYTFTGGGPPTLPELRIRYGELTAGSPRPAEIWLNWIVRIAANGQAVGTVQTTIRREDPPMAEVAWVIGQRSQGNGYASEAARALVGWLLEQGVGRISAHIHPDHRASGIVADRAGLRPTNEQVDGEQVWTRDPT